MRRELAPLELAVLREPPDDWERVVTPLRDEVAVLPDGDFLSVIVLSELVGLATRLIFLFICGIVRLLLVAST